MPTKPSTSPVDIRPDHLEIVQGILREHLTDGFQVWVFSSRAKWTATDASDLELAVEGPATLDHKAMVRLEVAFEESDLPYTVDVVDLNAVSDSFRQIVEGQGVSLPLKDSHVRTNSDWRKVVLGEIAELNSVAYSPKEDWPFINYLDTGSITENHISEIQHLVAGVDKIPSRARRKVEPSNIVYSTVRPNQRHFGLIRDVPNNFLASTGFAVIRGKSNVAHTDYIYWLLAQDHIVEYLHSIAENSTSAYPSIRPGDLEQLPFSLPPLPEQRAIAHILGTLDDKIELNRRMNETLDQMARAIFQDWFVDFGPVRAKLEGREPYLTPELWDLFPDRLVDSELGEVPEGWGVKALGEVAKECRRGVKPGEIDAGTAYIALEHMPKHSIALAEWTTADGVESGKFAFEQGDILFGKLRPYFHKVGVAPLDGVCSTDIVVVSPKSPEWFGYILGHVSSTEFVNYTDAASTGTRMPRTKWQDMARYQVPLPSKRLAEAFAERIHPSVDRIIAATCESHTLAALRDTLLPKLVSGEVRVNAGTNEVS